MNHFNSVSFTYANIPADTLQPYTIKSNKRKQWKKSQEDQQTSVLIPAKKIEAKQLETVIP